MDKKYYYIYEITNVVNGKRYRGQHTTTNLNDGYMGSGSVLSKAKKKYGEDKFIKDILMYCSDSDDLNYWEELMVDKYWCDREDTYNLKTGGGHPIYTDEYRKSISEGTIKRFKNQSERDKIRNAHIGKKMSNATKQKIIASHLGKKNPNAISAMNESRKRKIAQYDIDMNLICIYDSIADAERKTGLRHGNICQCCRQNPMIKTVGGFVFRYVI